nr:MAG TPA: hypothetical protein [Caudoviricetes sp.]
MPKAALAFCCLSFFQFCNHHYIFSLPYFYFSHKSPNNPKALPKHSQSTLNTLQPLTTIYTTNPSTPKAALNIYSNNPK